MKIKMIKSIRGSLDGATVVDLEEGREYDTVDSPRGERLAKSHIAKGAAVAVIEAPAQEAAEPIEGEPEPKAKSARRKA